MSNTYIEISAEDNDEDVTELIKNVVDQTPGIIVKTKEGGSIKITGDAKIQFLGGAINIS